MKYILLISIILNVTGVVAQSPTIDSLKQIVALQKHDTVELNALLNLSNEFLRRDLSLAKQYSSELIKLANNPTEVKWLSAAYNYLITIYQQTGKPDSSRYFLARSEAITRQNASNGKIKYNFNQAAGLFYKNSGEYNQALPIIALTASATSNVKSKVLEAGMQDYVTKPFNPNDFFLRLKKYL